MHEDRSKSMNNDESADIVETSLASSRPYVVMDDKLYDAVRVMGKAIPSSITGDEIIKSRTRGEERNTVFHVAAIYGNEGFIRKVLEDNQHRFYSLFYEKNTKGETPLHLAAQFGHKKTVEALLDAHDHYEHKSYWSEKDKLGDTPLHVALRYAHQDIAILLVQRDANMLSIDNQAGESPAYLAATNLCERFFHEILDIEGYNQRSISFSGPFDMTVFHPARILNDDIMLTLIDRRKELLKHQDNKGKTILHYAVEDNIEPMVEILLKADSSLACLHDNDGMTPLHIATSMGSFPMVRAILELSPQSISIVCKTGDYKGKTALHVAKMDVGFLRVCLGHTRMKELINVPDNEGNTPLHLALKKYDDLDTADVLLEAGGVNWRLRNSNGCTPMDLCKPDHKIQSSKLVSKLEGDGVNGKVENVDQCNPINLCNSDDKIPSKLKKYTSEYWRMKDEVNMQLFYGSRTCLDRLLTSSNATDWEEVFTSYRGAKGESIVHVAARRGHMGIINKAAHEWDCKSRVLVLSGENSRGETPLHVAAAAGKRGVVDVILQLSISTDKLGNKKPEQLGVVVESSHLTNQDRVVKNNSEWKPWRTKSSMGDTPLHLALRNGHEQIALLLLKWDPQLIYASVNKANESLLYLAALNGLFVAIFEMTSDYEKPHFSINASGPHGQNACHAALRRSQATSREASNAPSFNFERSNVLEANHSLWIDYTIYYLSMRMPQLLNKVDSDGKTPLHYFVELDREDMPWNMLDQVEGRSAAFMYDNEGFTPLLRAVANGYYPFTYVILTECPHSLELRHAHTDSTVLHLLKITSSNAFKEWMGIIKKHPQMEKMINETDKDGNTPLHCAILESDVNKTHLLLSTKGVRLSIQNEHRQTPMDICTQLMTNGDSKQLAIWIALEDAKAREEERSSQVPLILRINTHVMTTYSEGVSSDENLKKLLENVAVAAALLITLTFAATFTVPGGYDGDTGQALRMKETSVKVFVASDVVAMLLGVGVLLTYTFGATKPAWLRVLAIPCVAMLQFALLATIVSFISGVYALVFQDAKWIATLAVAIVGGVLLLFSVTPAAADVVIPILKRLRKAGKVLLAILLIIPYFVARVFDRGYVIGGLIDQLAPTMYGYLP